VPFLPWVVNSSPTFLLD